MQRFKLLDLFLTFMKIGGFTLGGGYAMLPIIQHEIVDKKNWVSDEQMADYLTLAQASPGVIGINTATAVGFHIGGIKGSIAATLGMVTPSVIIIIIIAALFSNFKSWVIVQHAFQGVRSAIVALMAIAVMRLAKNSVQNNFQRIIAVAAAALVIFFGVPPQYVILGSAVTGIIYFSILKLKKEHGHGDTP